jgi:hypothetical protein
MRIAIGPTGRYASHMKRRQRPDLYTDTMLWIMDGRRSWNRKPRKPRPAINSRLQRALVPGKQRS